MDKRVAGLYGNQLFSNFYCWLVMFGELTSFKGHWASPLPSQHPSLQEDCQISRNNYLRCISRTGGQQNDWVDATVMERLGRPPEPRPIPQDCVKHWPCHTCSMRLHSSVRGSRRTLLAWMWWSKHWRKGLTLISRGCARDHHGKRLLGTNIFPFAKGLRLVAA